MKENEVLETLAKVGLESQDALDSWSSSARLLSALDAIGRDGGTALIKVDGGRNDSLVYTVVVSGGRLGDDFFRKDDSDLQALLLKAVEFWVAHAQPDLR